jgi:hypothetical protein
MIVTDGFRDALVDALGAKLVPNDKGKLCYPPVVGLVSDLVQEWIPKFFLECATVHLPCGHPALRPDKQVKVIDCACGRRWFMKAEAGRTWNAQEIGV